MRGLPSKMATSTWWALVLQPPNQKEAPIPPTILYVGLDVDDTRYHGSALNKHIGEVLDFHCRPTLKGLLGQLHRLAKSFLGCSIRIGYEASYCGPTLQRALMPHGLPCDIVAPKSIPSPRGKPSRRTTLMRATSRSFTPRVARPE